MGNNNFSRRDFLKTLGLGVAAMAATSRLNGGFWDKKVKKPNIIYIMADDLGKEWISCYGAEKIKTPVIDNLAQTGMRFENFYCMPQCTPTRMSLLTGQYPFNHGFVNHWDVPRWGGGCHFDPYILPSIGNLMKSAGYRTAIAGKWQLDDFRVEPKACVEAGFDEYCMWTGGEADNLKQSEKRYWDAYIHTKEGSRIYKKQFGPNVYTEFLLNFIEENKDKPVFVYYPMCLPHGPNTTTPHKPNVKGKEETFIAMVEYIDHLTGRIVNKLDELGIRDNTIVIWTTDNGNGGAQTGIINGRKVKGGKGTMVEQNINVPFIVNCPGKVPQGVVTDALSDVTDILPTVAELCHANLPKNYKNDGISIVDVILGKTADSKREWIMAMGGKNQAKMTDKGPENEWYWRDRVVRNKRYKLYVAADKKPEKLIDLQNDPVEENNLIDSNDPKIKNVIKKLYDVIYKFPEKDNDFVYRPNPPQPWDVKPIAKSQVWKKGRPE